MEFGGAIVYPAERISELCGDFQIKIGIITVPKEAAQLAAEALVRGGATAIWNFAPIHLNLPPDIAVRNEDMAASLALLMSEMKT
jgi:redox-sensing transcriptional repressor